MKQLSKFAAVFLAVGLLVSVASAQSIYSTPYTFATIAGLAGTNGASNGVGSAAHFYYPAGIVADGKGNLYVVDNNNNTIRKMTSAGTNWMVTTIAGSVGNAGDVDGTNTSAWFNDPIGIALDTNGNLYVGEDAGEVIRKITPVGTNWVVSTIAGSVENPGFADGTNTAAQFEGPDNLVVDTNGNVYVADSYNSVIRKITPVGTNWVVTTIIGSVGNPGNADGTNTAAQFYEPYAMSMDHAGNIYVTDIYWDTIRKMVPAGTNWVVTTIAGSGGNSGSSDGMGTSASFNSPYGIAVGSAGNLFVADSDNDTIRTLVPVGTNWMVSTIAGITGTTGSTDGFSTNTLFNLPWGITADSSGNLYVADNVNDTIRMGWLPVTTLPNLTIKVVAGSVTVFWPTTAGAILQSNGNLKTTNWVNYAGIVNAVNNTNSAVITTLATNQFFRLIN